MLETKRKRVLQGVRAFCCGYYKGSGPHPVEAYRYKDIDKQSTITQRLEALGAQVANKFDDDVTHVIVTRWIGTTEEVEKIIASRVNGQSRQVHCGSIHAN
eukprot:GHVU01039612.1.p1 GENE.GHVU01039612.1~~GHVU01039612.1.p1  ORF type:complete len:101 (+),score=9.16 GHVU01039612.1:149-451(+)